MQNNKDEAKCPATGCDNPWCDCHPYYRDDAPVEVPVSGAVDEKAEFVKWSSRVGKGLRLHSPMNEIELTAAWQAWQARAALQPAQTAPTDGHILAVAEGYADVMVYQTVIESYTFDEDALLKFARALLASQPTAAVSDERAIVEAITRLERLHSTKEERFAAADGLRALLSHPAEPAQPTPAVPHVDDLAWFIRTVDGDNSMGAGMLAERICDWLSNPLSAPAAQQPNNYRDAYRGARDDLLQWKRRALEAEESCRRLTDALNTENGPTHIGEPVLAQQPSEQNEDAISAAMAEGNKHGVKSSVAACIVAAYLAQQPSDFDSKAQRAEAWDAVVAALNAAKPDWMDNNLSGMGAAVLAIQSATWQQPSETAIHNAAIEAAAKVCEGHTFGSPVAAHAIRALLHPAAQEAEPKNAQGMTETQRLQAIAAHYVGAAASESPSAPAGLAQWLHSINDDGYRTDDERCAARLLLPIAQEAAREQPAKGEK